MTEDPRIGPRGGSGVPLPPRVMSEKRELARDILLTLLAREDVPLKLLDEYPEQFAKTVWRLADAFHTQQQLR